MRGEHIKPADYHNQSYWSLTVGSTTGRSDYRGPGASLFSEEEDRDFEQWTRLPFSGLCIEVWDDDEDQIYQMTQRIPKLHRLHDILQLAAKSDQSLPLGGEGEIIRSLLPHTRYNHTLQVAGIGIEILRRSGREDLISLYTAGAMLHDIATPAYGDAIKPIDGPGLDEEEHWHSQIGEEGWSYLTSLGLTEEMIGKVIHNEGLAGQLLDIADRISYVCEDAFQLGRQSTYTTGMERLTSPIAELVARQPDIGTIYQHIQIEGDQVYCDDIERAKVFLELRAHLFHDGYLYPANNSRDVLLREVVEPLYRQGVINAAMLRDWDDAGLATFLTEYYQLPMNNLMATVARWHPTYCTFTSDLERSDNENLLRSQGHLVIGSYKAERGFSPGTKLLVQANDGIKPLSQADPAFHTRLSALSRERMRAGQIFYIDKDDQRTDSQVLRELMTTVHARELTHQTHRRGTQTSS